MKVFLDANLNLEEACRRIGRSVKEVEWGSAPTAAQEVAVNRLAALVPKKERIPWKLSRCLRIDANRPPSSRVDKLET